MMGASTGDQPAGLVKGRGRIGQSGHRQRRFRHCQWTVQRHAGQTDLAVQRFAGIMQVAYPVGQGLGLGHQQYQ